MKRNQIRFILSIKNDSIENELNSNRQKSNEEVSQAETTKEGSVESNKTLP